MGYRAGERASRRLGKFYAELGDELSLYVRQIAWLLAVPRVKGPDGRETKLPPRMESYNAQHAEPPLPSVTAKHISDWLMEIGPTEVGDMSQAPIGWVTIRAWQKLTFTRLSAWEARLLRRLSAEFLTESHLAEDHNRPAPWSPGRGEVDREADERQLRAVLG